MRKCKEIGYMVGGLMALAGSVMAAEGDGVDFTTLGTDLTTGITGASTIVKSVLGTAVTFIIGFVVFKLIKRASAKV